MIERERTLVPWRNLKMEPISALPGCVLQMTLKSSCSQTAFPCLSLRGNSEECDHCGSVPAVCVSAGERGREEGRKERGKGGRPGLAVSR